MKSFKQTPDNLLGELSLLLYNSVQQEYRCKPITDSSTDKAVHDHFVKYHMYLTIAYLLRALRAGDMEECFDILAKECAKDTTIYGCNVDEELIRIMVPLPEWEKKTEGDAAAEN